MGYIKSSDIKYDEGVPEKMSFILRPHFVEKTTG